MKRTLSWALALIAAFSGITSWADPSSQEYNLEIARQPLADTLREFSKQTALNISFVRKSRDQESIVVGPLKGRYTAESALSELLANSGMTFIRVNDLTIAVTDAAGHSRAVRTKNTAKNYVRLADQRSIADGDLDIGTQGAALHQVAAAGPAQPRTSAFGDRGQVPIEEVVTTGSRLRRVEGEGPAPLIVFDRKKIEELGVSSLPDVLKYSAQQPFTTAETNTLTGAQFAQLRGLPANSTAVLINGRRTVLSASDLGDNSVDLNMIPVGAIERVEILADSASAMYGADAIGGVVNVILRKDITRPVLTVRYGSADGGAQERRASLMTGYSSERFRASVLADYFDRDPLLGQERDRWSNQDYRRFGGANRRFAFSNPGAITSATSANLTGLPSRFALVRPGSSGVGLSPADFISVPTQADLNVVSWRRFEPIVFDQNRRSAAAFSEFDLTSAITIFAEGFYSDAKVIDQPAPPALAVLSVPSNNPFNPFNQPLTVRYMFEDIGPRRSTLEQDLYSVTAGAKGRLRSWDWEFSALSGKSTSSFRQDENAIVDTVQANCLLTNPATRAPGACRGITEALNVFQDGPGGSSALLASLVVPPSVFEATSKSTQATAFLRGDVFAMPAGPAEMVIGGSAGREEGEAIGTFAGDRRISAAFGEMRVPLVSPAMALPAIRSLSIQVAARHDHYSDFGDSFNPHYGLVWVPVAGLSLTASYGTSFSPPSLFNLFNPRVTRANVPMMDPVRNNETVLATQIGGGNPELDPEEGKSFIAGLVLSPQQLPDLRLSAHYWNVVLDNRSSTLSLNQVLANEALFPARVVRDAPGPTDPPGVPGALRSVDTSKINFGRLEASGVDWTASYSFDTSWGRFSQNLSATWNRTYEAEDFPGSPVQQRVGIASFGTIPRWRAFVTLAWAKQGVGLSTTARYTHGYADTILQGGLLVPAPSGRTISSQTLIDFQASFAVDDVVASGSFLTKGLKISAGVSNLFDKEPRFYDALAVGYDPSQADLIGRTVYVNLSKGF